MATPKKSKYRPSDIRDAEHLYCETSDPMYLALAVGSMPHLPPLWVIEACAALTQQIAALADRGNEQARMGRRLDEMWRFYFDTPSNYEHDHKGHIVSNVGPPLAAAARHAIAEIDGLSPGHQLFASHSASLQREWRHEREAADAEAEEFLFDGLRPTERSKRILLEWGDREAGIPYRYVSLQMARVARGVSDNFGAIIEPD